MRRRRDTSSSSATFLTGLYHHPSSFLTASIIIVQGSGMRQCIIWRSNCRVCQSSLAYRLRTCDNKDGPTTPTTRPNTPPSKASTLTSRPRTRVKWMPEDDTKLVDMKKSGRSWKEINAAFPGRTPGTIQVQCSTKLKSRLA
jgi:hypothetical protein